MRPSRTTQPQIRTVPLITIRTASVTQPTARTRCVCLVTAPRFQAPVLASARVATACPFPHGWGCPYHVWPHVAFCAHPADHPRQPVRAKDPSARQNQFPRQISHQCSSNLVRPPEHAHALRMMRKALLGSLAHCMSDLRTQGTPLAGTPRARPCHPLAGLVVNTCHPLACLLPRLCPY